MMSSKEALSLKAIRYDNHAFNTKYCLCQMLRDKVESPLGKQLKSAQTNEEICVGYGLQEYYKKTQAELQARREAIQTNHNHPNHPVLDGDVTTMRVKFERREYPGEFSPKMFLLEWSRKENLEQPRYETVQRSQDRAFQSIVMMTGKKYRSTLWEKSKKYAEQASAIVCLRVLGLPEGRTGEEYSGLVGKRKREEKSDKTPDEGDTTEYSGARKRHLSENPEEQQVAAEGNGSPTIPSGVQHKTSTA